MAGQAGLRFPDLGPVRAAPRDRLEIRTIATRQDEVIDRHHDTSLVAERDFVPVFPGRAYRSA